MREIAVRWTDTKTGRADTTKVWVAKDATRQHVRSVIACNARVPDKRVRIDSKI